jgi:hypothetical protein
LKTFRQREKIEVETCGRSWFCVWKGFVARGVTGDDRGLKTVDDVGAVCCTRFSVAVVDSV